MSGKDKSKDSQKPTHNYATRSTQKGSGLKPDVKTSTSHVTLEPEIVVLDTSSNVPTNITNMDESDKETERETLTKGSSSQPLGFMSQEKYYSAKNHPNHCA